MQEVIINKKLKLSRLSLSEAEKEKLGQIESITDKIDQVTESGIQVLYESIWD